MHQRTAAALLISIVAMQLWSLACPALHHSASGIETAAAAHSASHHGEAETETPAHGNDRRAEDCIMATCSAVTPATLRTEDRILPKQTAKFATLRSHIYRNPPLSTLTPPPKFG